MTSKAFFNSTTLAYSDLRSRLKRMRSSHDAVSMLDREADGGQCTQKFVNNLEQAFKPARWSSSENLIARAAAMVLRNPETLGTPSVSTVVSAVVTAIAMEGARRRKKWMDEVLQAAPGDVSGDAPPVSRRRARVL